MKNFLARLSIAAMVFSLFSVNAFASGQNFSLDFLPDSSTDGGAFVATVPRGDSFSDGLMVNNLMANQDILVDLGFLGAGDNPVQPMPNDWLVLDEEELVVAASDSEEVGFTVNVPDDAPLQTFKAIVFVGLEGDQGQLGGAQFDVSIGYAVIVEVVEAVEEPEDDPDDLDPDNPEDPDQVDPDPDNGDDEVQDPEEDPDEEDDGGLILDPDLIRTITWAPRPDYLPDYDKILQESLNKNRVFLNISVLPSDDDDDDDDDSGEEADDSDNKDETEPEAEEAPEEGEQAEESKESKPSFKIRITSSDSTKNEKVEKEGTKPIKSKYEPIKLR